jgi:hypothetical protein
LPGNCLENPDKEGCAARSRPAFDIKSGRPSEERDEGKNQEHDEAYLGNPGCGTRDDTKSENSSDYCDNQKNNGVMKHDDLRLFGFVLDRLTGVLGCILDIFASILELFVRARIEGIANLIRDLFANGLLLTRSQRKNAGRDHEDMMNFHC